MAGEVSAKERPLVVAVSINGERSKSANPNVPIGPDQIVATALSCYDAGASIIHCHNASTALTGQAAADDYLAAWRRIRAERPGVLWYPTLTRDGCHDLDHVRIIDEAIGLEFACCDPGSVGFATVDAEGIPMGGYYTNSYEQIRANFAQLAAWKLGPQIAIYEPGYLRTVLAYLDMLDGVDLPWTVSVWGGDLFRTDLPEMAIERGGHLQIGLESHFDPVDKPTNEDQIRAALRLAERAGRPVADREATLAVWRSPRLEARTLMTASLAEAEPGGHNIGHISDWELPA